MHPLIMEIMAKERIRDIEAQVVRYRPETVRRPSRPSRLSPFLSRIAHGMFRRRGRLMKKGCAVDILP